MPSLPWGACFALGAIVSPPDAVAAKAVLERLALPRLMLLLEGESLLNDATGLVLVRFAVAAALTGLFSIGQATGEFAILAIGGAVVGICFGEQMVARFDVVLAGIAAGRKELLRLHRSEAIPDRLLHAMERDLDLQEIAAQHALGDQRNEFPRCRCTKDACNFHQVVTPLNHLQTLCDFRDGALRR